MFDNGTNIGIGTISPAARFQIDGSTAGSNGTSGSGSLLWLRQTATWGVNAPYALWVDGYSYLNGFRINGADGQRAIFNQMSNTELGFGTNGGDITFSSNNGIVRRVHILNSNGNVGIGTSNPTTKLEISSGTAGVSGLKFTDLSSASTPTSSSNYLSLDASGNVIYATNGPTLPLINANGTNSPTTEVRDYNVWANRGNGFYLSDNLGAIANPIPNNGAWFTLSQVAKGATHFGQTALNDQGFWFRGGATSTIASNTWFRSLSLNANSRFAVQWDNSTNNSINLNNIDNGPVLFSTNNSERMRILANGNVGIGTSTPTNKLHILGDARFQFNTNNLGSGGDSVWAEFYGKVPTGIDSQAGGLKLGWYNTFGGIEVVRPGGASGLGLAFNYATVSGVTTEGIRLTNSGNVGIGNSSPVSTLHVNNSITSTATINTDAQVLRLSRPQNPGIKWENIAQFNLGSFSTSINANSRLDLVMNNGASTTTTNVMTWQANGRVGIGTSNPISALEVNGSATNTAAFNSGSATAIIFSNSNLAYTTANAGAFNLQGMKDGGTYTLAVQGTTSGTSNFTGLNPSGTFFTFRYINNGPTTTGTQTLYTFIVMGTTVYVYMATGFN